MIYDQSTILLFLSRDYCRENPVIYIYNLNDSHGPIHQHQYMFQISHFSRLSNHKRPVLNLYRNLIRLGNSIPSELSKDVLYGVKNTFRCNKKTKSPHAARDQLEYGYFWESILLEAIEKCSTENITSEIVKHKKMVQEKRKMRASRKLLQTYRLDQNNRVGTMMNNLRDYNQIAPAGTEEYEKLKSLARIDTFRKRAIRHLKRHKLISVKSDLDPFYIDVFIAPQLRSERYKKQNIWKMKRETTFKSTRLSKIITPSGPMTQLLVPGQGRRTSKLRAMRVRNMLKMDFKPKIERLDNLIELAKYEAWWEKHVEKSELHLPALTLEWTGPIKEYRNTIVQRRLREYERNENYRQRLVSKKKYIDNILRGKVRRNKELWQSRLAKEQQELWPIVIEPTVYRHVASRLA